MNRSIVARVAVVALVTANVVVHAAGWPHFRGPGHDGISPDTGINRDWKKRPPKELWRISLSDRGYAGPSVAAGKLFIIDHDGTDDVVRAVDIKSGKDVWKYKYPELIKHEFGWARSTPSFDDGRLYTLSRTGTLNCLNAENGTKYWSLNIQKEFGGKMGSWQYASSPFIDGEKLIVLPGGDNASVVALDKRSGQTLWKGGGSDQAGYATPVAATIEGKKQYVVFTGEGLIGVDAGDGKLLWSFPWATSHKVNAATPIVVGNQIFITSDYGKGCGLISIKDNNPTPVWQSKDIKSQFSTPILVDGFIYGTNGRSNDAGQLVCMNVQTGAVAWRFQGFEAGGLIGMDGVLIVVDGKKGDLVMANLTTKMYQELGRITPLGGQSWTAPIIADGMLFIRNTENLVCLDLK
jgi:outer membrane protein assembly factor BamB